MSFPTSSTSPLAAVARVRDVALRLDDRPVVIARMAATWATRLRGLLFRPPLIAGEGLLIVRCGSVHTCLMGYPIDVVYLDDALRVVKVAPALGRWRFSLGGRRARHTLELAAGEAARIGLVPGALLTAGRDRTA